MKLKPKKVSLQQYKKVVGRQKLPASEKHAKLQGRKLLNKAHPLTKSLVASKVKRGATSKGKRAVASKAAATATVLLNPAPCGVIIGPNGEKIPVYLDPATGACNRPYPA
jgi:hypothetical protein